jgi:putative transposase
MPNHWHIICKAECDGEISKWLKWLQMMHTISWHKKHKTRGQGHFYQSRYKSFIIDKEEDFLRACLYVERNALRARLVSKAEDWLWSSAHYQNKVSICEWPIIKPKNYLEMLNDKSRSV